MCCVLYRNTLYKPSPVVLLIILVDNHDPLTLRCSRTILHVRTYHITTTTTTALELAVTTVILCTLHIEILVWHAVVWHRTHPYLKEGVACKASKEAINFDCNLEWINPWMLVAELSYYCSISIRTLVNETIKLLSFSLQFLDIVTFATHWSQLLQYAFYSWPWVWDIWIAVFDFVNFLVALGC